MRLSRFLAAHGDVTLDLDIAYRQADRQPARRAGRAAGILA